MQRPCWPEPWHLRLRSDEVSPREFMAFYTVGHVLNESPPDLYKTGPFLAKYHALFPSVPGHKEPVFVHAPFEGLFFQPFARIPYRQALVAWQVFSLGLIGAGFTLVWVSTSSLPRSLLPVALLVAISFHPVSVALLLSGQVSGLTFLWIALAIWCQRRGWDHGSGAALSLCLAKPTLLILLVPMLLVGQRWRMVVGFGGGAGVVALASLMMIGWGTTRARSWGSARRPRDARRDSPRCRDTSISTRSSGCWGAAAEQWPCRSL